MFVLFILYFFCTLKEFIFVKFFHWNIKANTYIYNMDLRSLFLYKSLIFKININWKFVYLLSVFLFNRRIRIYYKNKQKKNNSLHSFIYMDTPLVSNITYVSELYNIFNEQYNVSKKYWYYLLLWHGRIHIIHI